MKPNLRSLAFPALLTLLAACGTDAASRTRTDNGDEDTTPADTAADTAVEGSGDTGTSDTTLDTAGSGDTGTDTGTSDTT